MCYTPILLPLLLICIFSSFFVVLFWFHLFNGFNQLFFF